MPTISFDFCFLCQKDQGKSIPTMVARDHKTIYTSAFTCPGKSTKEEEYSDQIVERCQNFVNSLGYKRVTMKSDQEKSMLALQQRVQKGVNCEMVLTNSKKYDSKSNGKIEKAVQDVEGQVRTLKLHLENRIGEKIPPNHPMIHWMVECAAETINRFRIVKGKATPREMLRASTSSGRWQSSERVSFGSRRRGRVDGSSSWSRSSKVAYGSEFACARTRPSLEHRQVLCEQARSKDGRWRRLGKQQNCWRSRRHRGRSGEPTPGMN